MEKACIGFEMPDAAEAWEHMKFEIVKDYGDYAYGHCLHTWDDGKRMLARCRTCGGYILIAYAEASRGSCGEKRVVYAVVAD